MLLSLSGFLFEDGTLQSIEFEPFCKLTSNAGYNGIELRNSQIKVEDSKLKRSEIKNIIDSYGLIVTCLTTNGPMADLNHREERFWKYLEFCKDMDCKLLKIKLSFEPQWLYWASEQANKAHISLSINNHIGTVLETVLGTRKHLSQVGHCNYGLLYDSMHLMLKSEDYLGCVPEFASATRNILIQSMRKSANDEEPILECDGGGWVKAMPGENGVQNWKEVLRLFKKSGYDGLITVIENGFPADKREYVATFYADYLSQLWKEV